MHEVGIMKNVLEIAEAEARAKSARAIRAIGMRIGAMSAVVPESLAFAFEALKEGTMAAHARLEVEWVPLVAYCEFCDLEFETEDRYGIALCPKCEEPSGTIVRGNELEISYLEVV